MHLSDQPRPSAAAASEQDQQVHAASTTLILSAEYHPCGSANMCLYACAVHSRAASLLSANAGVTAVLQAADVAWRTSSSVRQLGSCLEQIFDVLCTIIAGRIEQLPSSSLYTLREVASHRLEAHIKLLLYVLKGVLHAQCPGM